MKRSFFAISCILISLLFLTTTGCGYQPGDSTVLVIGSGISRIEPIIHKHRQIVVLRFQQPSSLKVIGARAFEGNRLRELRLPDGLNRIEEGAFEGNNLILVFIPKSVKYIGKNAFAHNPGLKKVHVPAGAEYDDAFDKYTKVFRYPDKEVFPYPDKEVFRYPDKEVFPYPNKSDFTEKMNDDDNFEEVFDQTTKKYVYVKTTAGDVKEVLPYPNKEVLPLSE